MPTSPGKRSGVTAEGEWWSAQVEQIIRLAEVNAGGGGCNPIPLPHALEGEELVIAEADILGGWRLFR